MVHKTFEEGKFYRDSNLLYTLTEDIEFQGKIIPKNDLTIKIQEDTMTGATPRVQHLMDYLEKCLVKYVEAEKQSTPI